MSFLLQKYTLKALIVCTNQTHKHKHVRYPFHSRLAKDLSIRTQCSLQHL